MNDLFIFFLWYSKFFYKVYIECKIIQITLIYLINLILTLETKKENGTNGIEIEDVKTKI